MAPPLEILESMLIRKVSLALLVALLITVMGR